MHVFGLRKEAGMLERTHVDMVRTCRLHTEKPLEVLCYKHRY